MRTLKLDECKSCRTGSVPEDSNQNVSAGQIIQTFTRFFHNFVNVVVPLEVTRQGEAQHFGFRYDINVFTINNNSVERGGFGGEANAELFEFRLIKFKFVHGCTG